MSKKKLLARIFLSCVLVGILGGVDGSRVINAQAVDNFFDFENIDPTNIIESDNPEEYLTVLEVEALQEIMRRPDYLDLEEEQFEEIFNELMNSKMSLKSGSSIGIVGGTKEFAACKLSYSLSQCNYALQTSRKAQTETKRRFGINGMDDKSDAFRHAFWNALMANGHGVSFAKTIADNHEKYNPGSALANQMDLYNNAQGRSVRNFGSVCYLEADLSNAVYSLLTSGKLKYIKNNKLVWSNM